MYKINYLMGTLVLTVLTNGMALATEAVTDQSPKPLQVARSEDAAPRPFSPTTGLNENPSALDAAKATPAELNSNPTKPKVALSHAHKATCLKFVNDKIDDVTVTDITGSDHKLLEMLSDRLTVLIFWKEESISGLEQFRRIPVDVLGTFASHRVKVIAANVGGEVASTKKITGDGADKIVSLVDSEAKLFGQVAKSHVPRTYVLDKDGKILWFDLEYSQSTRRSLTNALTYFLKKQG